MNDQVGGKEIESNERPSVNSRSRLRGNKYVLGRTLNVSLFHVALGILALDLLVTLLGGLLL